jgi:acyl carrier protein
VLDKPGLELEKQLMEAIVEVCGIEDPIPDDISPDDPLLGPESVFGLDSLDAVEIVVAVEVRYKVRIGADENSRRVFRSLRTLADHIRSERKAAGLGV